MLDENEQPQPCPWCTEEAELLETFGEFHGVQVNCKSCGALGPTEESEDEAIWQWDRIKSPAITDELVSACKEAEGVLTEPGLIDVDECKACQKRIIFQLRSAIKKAKDGGSNG